MKFKSLLLKRRFEIGYFLLNTGAGEETRTPTHKAPEPKSGASTNFATPAGVKKEKLDGVEFFLPSWRVLKESNL